MKKQNIYDGVLSFRGTWRKYQQRVLEEADTYLKDGKVHIVAAPGAGKTTLGIELIRRIGNPCLILSPRIVIRQQWLERIHDSFMEEETDSGKKVLSHDIREPGLITSLTYQTLFFGMTGGKGVEEDADGSDREEMDFSDFPFIRKVKEAGITTICLDECHHLKSEWWKALENFMKEMGKVTVISLTATPPYDAAPAQWERYIKMCGPIDAEITIPELVKEKSLCPHQDYVWFNYPTKAEEEKICQFREKADEVFQRIMEDEVFAKAVSSHKCLMDYESCFDRMLENPAYLSALLIYCQQKGIPFVRDWLEVLTVKNLPEMSEKWMENLLQGFLFDDPDSYTCSLEYREHLMHGLKAAGLIHHRKVNFLVNDKVEKLLINSQGKMESIRRIAFIEYASMGQALRMLILTDYIRKEYRSVLGKEKEDLTTMGVLPIFELLRRQDQDWKIAVMCGSVVIIPDSAKEIFRQTAAQENDLLELSFRALEDEEGRSLGYCEAVIGGKLQIYTRIMTRLFEEGYFQILVGTKSLLGEGWDAPCVNSLVMASFVGSYVLGNQMRGRAIRTCSGAPDKVSNIWHLVCLSNPKEKKEKRRMGVENPELSEDYYTLERRMKGILGLSYEGGYIENGIGRLTIIREPYSRSHIESINKEMEARSARRHEVAREWKEAITLCDQMETADQYQTDESVLRPGMVFIHALAFQLLTLAAEGINILSCLAETGNLFEKPRFYIITAVFLLFFIFFGGKILKFCTPMRFFRSIGKGVLKALREDGQITSECIVMTEEEEGLFFAAWLKGGTEREKSLFADSMEEMLSPVENQRYLLGQGKKGEFPKRYYCVPKVFSASREKAEFFQNSMEPFLGKYELIYTRSPQGRKILLQARARAFANRNRRRAERRKKIKSALE